MGSFTAGQDKEAEIVVSTKIPQELHNRYSGAFQAYSCFTGTFSLQFKESAKPYQALPRCMASTLQEPFTKELERIQWQQIKVPLGG